MSIRTRMMSGEAIRGYVVIGRGQPSYRQAISMSKTFTDYVGNRDGDNPASYERVIRAKGVANGQRGTPNTGSFVAYNNYPLRSMIEASPQHANISMPSLQELATAGAAQTNPGKPSIQLPVSIAELRDLPAMVLSRYRRRGGQTNSLVESEFGWQPMISDIQKLFSMPALIESRIKTLNLLARSSKPVSRQRTVFDDSVETLISDDYVESSTAGAVIRSRRWSITRATARVTARWQADGNLRSLTDYQIALLAREIALGIHPKQQISNLWELLPWSWLADWFVNFGDLLSVTNNSVAHTVGYACVSVRRDTEILVELKPLPSGIWASAPQIRRSSWTRNILYPWGLAASAPFLTTRQTLILASIAFGMKREITS